MVCWPLTFFILEEEEELEGVQRGSTPVMAIFDLEAGRPSALLDARGTLASTAAGRDTPVSNPSPARVVSDGPLRAGARDKSRFTS